MDDHRRPDLLVRCDDLCGRRAGRRRGLCRRVVECRRDLERPVRDQPLGHVHPHQHRRRQRLLRAARRGHHDARSGERLSRRYVAVRWRAPGQRPGRGEYGRSVLWRWRPEADSRRRVPCRQRLRQRPGLLRLRRRGRLQRSCLCRRHDRHLRRNNRARDGERKEWHLFLHRGRPGGDRVYGR